MTANGFVDWARIVKVSMTGAIVIFGLGKAYGLLEQRIASKADSREVLELRIELQAMARDVRTIRLMLCDGKQADSYCRVTP